MSPSWRLCESVFAFASNERVPCDALYLAVSWQRHYLDRRTLSSQILKEGRKPINLQTDDGKEFYNKTFQALMKRKDIHHFSTSGDTKASAVKWFNRTLKQRLYRYFTVKNTLNFVPVQQDLVQGYNRSFHRSIKMAPNEVTQANSPEVWETLYGKKKRKVKRPRSKVGDRVSLN